MQCTSLKNNTTRCKIPAPPPLTSTQRTLQPSLLRSLDLTSKYDSIADEAYRKTKRIHSPFHLHGFLIAFDGMLQRFSDLNWKLDVCLVRCRCRSSTTITELLIADLLGTCWFLLDVLKFPLSRRVCSFVLELPPSGGVVTFPLSWRVCCAVLEFPLSWGILSFVLSWGILSFDRIPFLSVVLFVDFFSWLHLRGKS